MHSVMIWSGGAILLAVMFIAGWLEDLMMRREDRAWDAGWRACVLTRGGTYRPTARDVLRAREESFHGELKKGCDL